MKRNKIKNRGFSTVAIVVVVVAILAIVAFVAIKGLKLPSRNESTPTTQAQQDPQVKALNQQSSSDEVGAIDKDANNTNIDNLDSDLSQITKDVGSL